MKAHLLWLFIVAILVCAGCAQVAPISPVSSTPRMVLAPGDEIEVKFAYSEQFNETQIIRPDGMIELPIIGEIQARGKKPSELRKELIKLYTPHLKHPQLSVMVREFRSRRVWVGGEVMRTGFIDMPGPMTALEAIMNVGGFREETANIEEVVLIRHMDFKRYSYKISVKESFAGNGKPTEMFYLEPRDIVFVPQKGVVNVNQWIDQYIRKMIPIPMSSGTFIAPKAAE
jgi:protein involved in polysaccharide export with SLBB domain